MDLQVTVFLLFVLFTAGHSLSCYECLGLTGSCVGQTVETCPSGSSKCLSATAVAQTEIPFLRDIKVKAKGCIADCISGSISLSIGKISVACCNTDKCNVQDAPDPAHNPNGKTCYSCNEQNCSTIMSCSGSETRCIKATASHGRLSMVEKGCASQSICDATATASVRNVVSFSCCKGNLCNGAKSVTQSFLFLCCSLLSFILLH